MDAAAVGFDEGRSWKGEQQQQSNDAVAAAVDAEAAASSSSSDVIVIGGTKGHVVETVRRDSLFARLYGRYRWKMIPNCTGRYTCRDHRLVSHLHPLELVQRSALPASSSSSSSSPLQTSTNTFTTLREYQFQLPDRNDGVIVVPLDDDYRTGIIAYAKKKTEEQRTSSSSSSSYVEHCDSTVSESDIRYVHTLNGPSGFRRKLEAVGIDVVVVAVAEGEGTFRLVQRQQQHDETKDNA